MTRSICKESLQSAVTIENGNSEHMHGLGPKTPRKFCGLLIRYLLHCRQLNVQPTMAPVDDSQQQWQAEDGSQAW